MNKISNKILHYGQFKETLEKVVELMRSEYPSSVIIRGSMGSGKKTLIAEALKITNVSCACVSPEQFNDDYAAMRAIASELGYKVRGTTISELMNELRDNACKGKKIVIVLEDFEDLCTKRQSLLYNLMNLIHTNPTKRDKGPSLTLIGLTSNLEWAENIEKRVRSRLNAKCINLKLPYSNLNEFVEFTSLLLDGHKISPEFREQLEWMYWFTNRSIRTLKKYLLSICDIDKKGKLIVQFDPDNYKFEYHVVKNNLLRERLKHLTTNQLDLVKLAVKYCDTYGENGFTLGKLDRYVEKSDRRKQFDLASERVFRDTALLVRLRLFKPEKPEQVIGHEAVMYPAMTGKQFKAVVKGDESLHCLRTDDLWKLLK